MIEQRQRADGRSKVAEGREPALDSDNASRAERELADVLYYLQHGCEPCAQRHFVLARQYGASQQQIGAARRQARAERPTSSRPALG